VKQRRFSDPRRRLAVEGGLLGLELEWFSGSLPRLHHYTSCNSFGCAGAHAGAWRWSREIEAGI